MKLDRNVRQMNFGERGREIARLRRAIRRWANFNDNQCCHVEDDRLARTVGLKRAGRINLRADEFLRHCRRYVARRVRSGRMKR